MSSYREASYYLTTYVHSVTEETLRCVGGAQSRPATTGQLVEATYLGKVICTPVHAPQIENWMEYCRGSLAFPSRNIWFLLEACLDGYAGQGVSKMANSAKSGS